MNNIDLAGKPWEPIGSMADMEKKSTLFQGTFDGGNHTIYHLDYETDNMFCGGGLFGVSCGNLKNLTLSDSTVKVTDKNGMANGGIVGYNMFGSVDNCHAKNVSVTGNNCTGCIAGGSGGPITNCTVKNGRVTVINDNDFSSGKLVQIDVAECGGLIVGGAFGCNVENCSAQGVITATGKEPVGLGGIGGCLEMADCKVDVIINAPNGGHAIGGLCGYAGTHSNPNVAAAEGVVTHSYPSEFSNIDVKVVINAKDATHVGGLIGTGLYYYGEETCFHVKVAKVVGAINGAVTPGTIFGRATGSSYDNVDAHVLINGLPGKDAIGTTSVLYESADQ